MIDESKRTENKSCLNDCHAVDRCRSDECQERCMYKCWLEDAQKENAALKEKLERFALDALSALSTFTVTPVEGYLRAPHVLVLDIARLGKERDTLQQQLAESRARVAELEGALKFYADGEHFSGLEEWDTVSGEGDNWLFPQYDEDTIPKDFDFPEAIEIGEVARQALSRAEAKEEP